ncbi:MAG: tRNA (N(6)-L-threonylcarbamoyladenosine(37)-C(2))-methylthiotransferase MtaB [Magnetococcales bacterium]|nr:tRNA (N(6)-L-threonylcarbamoyladenosine(37)-C(2))-methylthiotransferase MtaB [Magnetococcales bacterium]
MGSLSRLQDHTLDRLHADVNGRVESGRPMTVLTMGCRVNQFESAVLGQGGEGCGFRHAEAGEASELVVINTCSVTGESDRQARQLIRRARRDHPGARIVVTGCYAQNAPERVAAMPGVDLVLGNGEKSRLWELLETAPVAAPESGGRIVVGDVATLTRVPAMAPVDRFGDRARAFLQAQDGCDRACAYCVIPRLRGPSRSVEPDRVVEQARRFLESGYEELVLTGVNLGAYGRDLAGRPTLAELARLILELSDVGRLRISSLDPLDIDRGLIALMGDSERLCAHLHLSIQSGDDGVRRRMGRGRGRDAVLERIARVRAARPDVVLGADFIVGFPSESEEAFQRTLELTEEAELSLLHVFPYSARPDTPAAELPSALLVPGERIRERAGRLRQAGEAQLERVLRERVGGEEVVLVETVQAEAGEGKSGGFLSVRLPGALDAWRGALMPVVVEGIDVEAHCLIGRVAGGEARRSGFR